MEGAPQREVVDLRRCEETAARCEHRAVRDNVRSRVEGVPDRWKVVDLAGGVEKSGGVNRAAVKGTCERPWVGEHREWMERVER